MRRHSPHVCRGTNPASNTRANEDGAHFVATDEGNCGENLLRRLIDPRENVTSLGKVFRDVTEHTRVRKHSRGMNASMVVIGHMMNPFDLNGSFSVHFTAEDFLDAGSSCIVSSKGFNLSVHAGSAKASALHFFVVRPADGYRVEAHAECPIERRNFAAIKERFWSLDRAEKIGTLDCLLHWDGAQGILTANWTIPRNEQAERAKRAIQHTGATNNNLTAAPAHSGK